MGELYRACDITLKRDVALKVLPAELSRDPERMARFQREAEVLASLDHPHIAPIFGMVESDDARALALSLVEGPTLAELIAAGPVPMEEVLSIARHVAEALEYAHERGVIHRDLKPANIKVNPDGVVKVLDFGYFGSLTPGTRVTSKTAKIRSFFTSIHRLTGYSRIEPCSAKPTAMLVQSRQSWTPKVLPICLVTFCTRCSRHMVLTFGASPGLEYTCTRCHKATLELQDGGRIEFFFLNSKSSEIEGRAD
jgi:serine/threonine protein kinase